MIHHAAITRYIDQIPKRQCEMRFYWAQSLNGSSG